ncbi:MAG TPA: hypothetical protein VN580_10200, partial [Clostridia bacterium]|nr:hypothetical protein [Clostridia bacterium]
WNYDSFLPILYSNPLAGFGSLLAGQFGYSGGGMNIFPGMYLTNPAQGTAKAIEPWLANVMFDVVFSAVLLVMSALRINPVRKSIFPRLKFKRK